MCIRSNNSVRQHYLKLVVIFKFYSSFTCCCQLNRINWPTISFKKPFLKVVKMMLILCHRCVVLSTIVQLTICFPNYCSYIYNIEISLRKVPIYYWVNIFILTQLFNQPVSCMSITVNNTEILFCHRNIQLGELLLPTIRNLIPSRISFILFEMLNWVKHRFASELTPPRTISFHCLLNSDPSPWCNIK